MYRHSVRRRVGNLRMRGPAARHIVVIGAGPVGCRAAALLAASGRHVTVYEEHPTIGHPLHCTGIVTPDLLDIMDLPTAVIQNRIRRMRLVAPDGSRGDLPSHDLVLDRPAFDRHLADQALKAGAAVLLGHRFVGFGRPGTLLVRAGGHVEDVQADVLIAADGPASSVAHAAGMNGRRRYLLGEQVRMSGEFPHDLYQVHLVVPGFFGWVVPESSAMARVGVAAWRDGREQLARLRTTLDGLGCVAERNRGLIPIYDPTSPVQGRWNGMDLFLVGDAAGTVKATTGGGIVPGLLAAQALHRSLIRGTSYPRELAALRRRLWAHLKIRAGLDALSDAQTSGLVRICASRKAARALERGSRDRPIGLLCSLLAAQPALAPLALVAAWRTLGPRRTPQGNVFGRPAAEVAGPRIALEKGA